MLQTEFRIVDKIDNNTDFIFWLNDSGCLRDNRNVPESIFLFYNLFSKQKPLVLKHKS